MTTNNLKIPKQYISRLNMNGLKGRMLNIPDLNNKRKEFLFVYGHHASLERMYGMAEALSDFGGVTMPDLPGFGGMDSFYSIKEKPTLDNLADYLASFMKLKFKNKKVTLVGFSFGFLVVTRMLQRYPDLCKNVDLVISLAGFAHHEDFVFTNKRHKLYILGSKILAMSLPSVLFRNIALNPTVIRSLYKRTHNAKDKFAGLSEEEYLITREFEVQLWRINHVRTHMLTSVEFLKVDNTTKEINVPACHVGVSEDKYFDNKSVEKNLKVIYKNLKLYKARTKSHSPSIIGDKKTASVMFPPALRKRLLLKNK